MSFVSPRWDAKDAHYIIDTTPSLKLSSRLSIGLSSSNGSTVFLNDDAVHNMTADVLHTLISEGSENKWFTKLPSHEQLLKRHQHRFSSLADREKNFAFLDYILMTPKTLTLVWSLITVKPQAPPQAPPKLEFEDSEGELDSEPEVSESDLPPVELKDDSKVTQEEYLLTRLRAARARVEAEQIKMQYFETTGRMPPDSEDEEDDE
jgi:hypothetical protein